MIGIYIDLTNVNIEHTIFHYGNPIRFQIYNFFVVCPKCYIKYDRKKRKEHKGKQGGLWNNR